MSHSPKNPRISDELDIDAMSIGEIDAAIAKLRRMNGSATKDLLDVELSSDIFSLEDDVSDCIFKETDGFACDARNLRGDWERVGRDMWIALLQQARSEKLGKEK